MSWLESSNVLAVFITAGSPEEVNRKLLQYVGQVWSGDWGTLPTNDPRYVEAVDRCVVEFADVGGELVRLVDRDRGLFEFATAADDGATMWDRKQLRIALLKPRQGEPS